MDGVMQRMIADVWLAAAIWFVLIAVAALAVTATVRGVSWLKPVVRLGARVAAATARLSRPVEAPVLRPRSR